MIDVGDKICVYCDIDKESKCSSCEKQPNCRVICYLTLSPALKKIYKKLLIYNKTTEKQSKICLNEEEGDC